MDMIITVKLLLIWGWFWW